LKITSLAQAKRIIKIVFGFTLLTAGAAMLVLPGPGIVVIALALAILSAEFVWARKLSDRLKESVQKGKDAITQRNTSRP